ncbi:MAG: hypothetical protein K9I74_01345 [Bacteroidales bacterium]|nr:hypothetical protein [Bacteroidales bacterium]
MNQEKEEFKDFDLSRLFLFLYKYRKPLIIVTVGAIFLSVLFSSPWFITPKYESEVIMYPSSSNSISKALLAENQGDERGILEYGEEAATEQMLQLLSSTRIRSKIISKYNLMEHYHIDPSSKNAQTKLYDAYDKNINFSRTEYMAVKVSVMDKDAQLAAKMANDIVDILDSVRNNIAKERAMKAYNIVKDEYLDLKKEIKKMEDSLTKLRRLGVHDYESQAERFNQQMAREIANGDQQGVKALEKKMEVLAEYGSGYEGLSQQLEYEREKLSHLKRKYREAKVDAFKVLPQKFVVDHAYKSEKTAYPLRWLIVTVATLSALIMTIIVLIVLKNIRELRRYLKSSNKK